MSRIDLILVLAGVNLLQFFLLLKLLRKVGEYEDALEQIGGIVSGTKKEKAPHPPPDPRKRLEWKIKR